MTDAETIERLEEMQNYKDFEDYFTSKYVYVIEEECGWN